jgi:hypothetical protein
MRYPLTDATVWVSGMPVHPRPYQDRKVALATMHRKEEAIAPALMEALGLYVVPAPRLDTDQLGTFAGEIPRRSNMLDTAVAKARMGMQATGLPLGLASEGSFGPHPLIPFFLGGIELMVFIDHERGLVVHETLVAEQTNFSHRIVVPAEPIDDFLGTAGFPSHGLIVRPHAGEICHNMTKGITSRTALDAAIGLAAQASADGKAHIETDMRAHMNPTRMRALTTLARQLGRRLASPCPACAAPGWGRMDIVRGLQCEECGTSTDMILKEVFACAAGAHREELPRSDGLTYASPAHCPYCNP